MAKKKRCHLNHMLKANTTNESFLEVINSMVVGEPYELLPDGPENLNEVRKEYGRTEIKPFIFTKTISNNEDFYHSIGWITSGLKPELKWSEIVQPLLLLLPSVSPTVIVPLLTPELPRDISSPLPSLRELWHCH